MREVENLIGWRKMKILPVGLLVSPFREGGMTSDLSEEAVCDVDDSHDAPDEQCTPGCGWYAFYDAKEIYGGRGWNPESLKTDDAIVEVSAVGKTWLHDKGFRTKQIRIESIWVPKGTDAGLVETLAEMYDLPVYEIPGREERPIEDDPPAADPPAFDWSKQLGAFKAGVISNDDAYKHFMGMSQDEWMKQFQGEPKWKSEKEKSSSPPSPPSAPSGKSPLTSAHQLQQKREFADQLLRSLSPSQSGGLIRKVDREAAEFLLAQTRAELSKAMGKCAFCTNPDIHTHDDLNELTGSKV